MAAPNTDRAERQTEAPEFDHPETVDRMLRELCAAPDPRVFVGALARLDHVLAGPASTIFRAVINGLRGQRGLNRVALLDVGCCYGVNGALLRYGMDIAEIFEHWGQRRLIEAEAEEVRDYDRRYFASLEPAGHFTMTGLDPSEQAVDFASTTGLLDVGYAEDLEAAAPSPALAEAAASIDLVIAAGWAGPPGEATIRHLLAPGGRDRPPWVAWFQRRTLPAGPQAEVLSGAGLATETLDGVSFPARRFAGASEGEAVMAALDALGLDADGKEADGYLHAAFHLARPAGEVDARPLERLLASYMPR